jgi:hypothetical protein
MKYLPPVLSRMSCRRNKPTKSKEKRQNRQTNEQPADEEKECKKKLILEGKTATEPENTAQHMRRVVR